MPPDNADPNKPLQNIVVWSLFVRLSHWLVAFLVVINFFNESGEWHRTLGYLCLAIVITRIGYGLWFSEMESSLFYIPRFEVMKLHLIEAWSGHIASPHAGHNPLGQLAVYLIWVLIALLAFTGWLSRTDAYWGVDWPVDLHLVLSTLLQVVVILHLAAVVIMSNLQKINLAKQMITGKSAQK